MKLLLILAAVMVATTSLLPVWIQNQVNIHRA